MPSLTEELLKAYERTVAAYIGRHTCYWCGLELEQGWSKLVMREGEDVAEIICESCYEGDD